MPAWAGVTDEKRLQRRGSYEQIGDHVPDPRADRDGGTL